MTQLSAHFKSSEFACRCGCGQSAVSEDLIDLLEAIRTTVNKPVKITSGRRCLEHNTKCGGKPRSQHMLGNAADITVEGLSPKQLAAIIERKFKPAGMGVYKTFVHVDVRSGPHVRW